MILPKHNKIKANEEDQTHAERGVPTKNCHRGEEWSGREHEEDRYIY